MTEKARQASRPEDYIGLLPAFSVDFGQEVITRAEQWNKNITGNGLIKQWRENYRMYLNADPAGQSWDEGSFSVIGDSGELLKVRFNEYRSLIQHILNMTVNTPAGLSAKAMNDDPTSLIGAQLWDNILEYYITVWRDGRITRQHRKAVELSLIMANGYLLCEWDRFAGKPYTVDQTGKVIHEGDYSIKARSDFDVYFDTNLEDEEERHAVTIRDYMNRFEVAARYKGMLDQEGRPLEEKIIALDSKTQADKSYHFNWDVDTDLIPVYKYYERASTMVPQGRYALILSADCIVEDGPNPYQDEFGQAIIPLITINASEGLGTLYGYSPGNDLAPVQMVYNLLASTLVTNYAAFGVQNVVAERGSDVSVSALSGAMNLVEINPGSRPPEGMNLTKLPDRIYDALAWIQKQGETESGVNSVIRGDPQESLKSGKALDVVAGAAAQFMSGLQFKSRNALQSLGNMMLNIGKKYVTTQRKVAIVGKNKVARSKSWTGQDLSSVGFVVAENSDPALRTIQARMNAADALLQAGKVSTAQEYFTVRETGKLEPLYKSEMSQLNLVHEENDMLMQGQKPPVMKNDNHDLHIKEHCSDIDSPYVRMSPQCAPMLANYLEHISWHERAKMGDFRTPEQVRQDNALQQVALDKQRAMGAMQPPAPGMPSQTPPPQAGQPAQTGQPQMPHAQPPMRLVGPPRPPMPNGVQQ